MAHYLSRFDRAIITAGRVFAFLFFVGIVLVPRAKHRLFLAFGLSRSPRYFARTRHLRRVPSSSRLWVFLKAYRDPEPADNVSAKIGASCLGKDWRRLRT